MGNKHGKPRGSSGAKARDDIPSTGARAHHVPPAAPVASSHHATGAPPAPTSSNATAPASSQPSSARPAKSSQLEFKLSHVDVSAIFAPHEIQVIRKHVANLLGQSESDPVVISKDEFFRFLGSSTSSLYVNRLYTIFDLSNKGHVTFEDLVTGLSVLNQKATREQKLLLSFHLLDPEDTGFVTKQMTTDLLRSCLLECRELEIDLSNEQIDRIVDSTFAEADLDRNGLIDIHEYQALDAIHPGLSDFLTVDAFGVLSHLEKVHSMSISGGAASAMAVE